PRPYAQSDDAIVTHALWHGLSAAIVCEHGHGLHKALRHVAADVVVAMVNPGEELRFLAHGFVPTPRTIRFIGKRLTEDAPPLPKRREAWHFTLGDLVFCTQRLDPSDPVLAATVPMVRALAGRVDELVVLCDTAGTNVADNVRVHE